MTAASRGNVPQIYIPLCFYFIGRGHRVRGSGHSSFTFHYASTLSVWKSQGSETGKHLHSTMLLLYPRGRRKMTGDELHLHSTMLLLYLFPASYSPDSYFIYIPLCFYFIDQFHVFSFLPLQFTFHYASTLSSAWMRAIRCMELIYIPLCFYFIAD